MRNLLLVLALSTPLLGHSQEFSVGARTGVGKNYFLRSGNTNYPCVTTWDKQAFVRYQSKKRFALEVGAEHYRYTHTANVRDIYEFYPETAGEQEIRTVTSSNMIFYISAQYDIMCRRAQNSCPLLKNMRSYIGIVLAPTSITDRNSAELRNVNTGKVSNYSYTNQSVAIAGGLNHTLTYRFSDHLSLSSVLSYRVDLPAAFSSYEIFPNNAFENHIGYQIGAGYTF